MSCNSSIYRPFAFSLTLVFKDERQFFVSDLKCIHTSVLSIRERLNFLKLEFYNGTIVYVDLNDIDRFNVSVLEFKEVTPFSLDGCDYGVREFAYDIYR